MAEEKSVGGRIRQIRELQKISREELASRTSMDANQIRKIEEEKVVPSLAPLIKIARALGVRLGTFLDDIEQSGPVVARAGAIEAFNKSARSMEPFIVEIEPSKQSDYLLSSHEGEEFIYVLEGVVEINYGKDVYRLEKGDSIYLDSIVSHNVHAGDHQSAKILAVFYTAY